MWEAIRGNIRRSRLLIGLMGAILVGQGALIGLWLVGPEGGLVGALGAVVLWLVMLAIVFLAGEQVVLFSAGARQITKQDAPRLWNCVEEMTIASGLGKMPRVYVIDGFQKNAFATGRKPENACVAVTSGLIRTLNRDELQGVIAHEIGHIRNLDIRFLTLASVTVGAIVLLSDMTRRSLWLGGGRRRSYKGGGQAQMAILAVTLLVGILAPICARIIYLACSRKREYLADASAARFTRFPEGLASALEKISLTTGAAVQAGVPRTLAPMFIVNPLQARLGSQGMFSTHPSTRERVRILRAMGGNAGWVDYERAFRRVVGKGKACIDSVTIESEKSVTARLPTAEPEPRQEALGRAREVGDLLDRMVHLLLIPCPCGVRIKVPQGLKRDSIPCPRCGRDHEVPKARSSAAGESAPGTGPLRYRRRSEGWESFRCACGRTLQLSPGLRVNSITCRKCRRTIELTAA